MPEGNTLGLMVGVMNMLTLNKKTANLLDGKNWLKNSFSIWRNIGKNNEEKKINHPAIFTERLINKLLDSYSCSEGVLIDPFAGSGTSLLCALNRGMSAIGFDIVSAYRDLFLNRAGHKCHSTSSCEYYIDDSHSLSNLIDSNSVDICITSPPYWDILNCRRTADGKEAENYSNLPKDIGNIKDYDVFLQSLQDIFTQVNKVLKFEAYCIINIMDIRKKGIFYPLHSDVICLMHNIGLHLEDIIIWDRQDEYNNMRPLGFPYKFIINKVHEYILVFRKQ